MIKPHVCPVCDKPFSASEEPGLSNFPFCNARCRSIDLFRWFDGRYQVVEEVDPLVAEFLKQDPDIKVEGDDSVLGG